MDLFSVLSGPFFILDRALPYLLFLLAALILTGNFAVKSFFDRCGLSLQMRYLYGGLIAALGLALITSFSFVATAALIVMLVVLATMAIRGGSRQVALANLAMAAILVPVAIIP